MAKNIKAKVTGGSLNIRKEADITSEIVGLLENGAEIEVAAEENGWCRYGEHYVMAKYLIINDPTPEEMPPADDSPKPNKPRAKKAAAK